MTCLSGMQGWSHTDSPPLSFGRKKEITFVSGNFPVCPFLRTQWSWRKAAAVLYPGIKRSEYYLYNTNKQKNTTYFFHGNAGYSIKILMTK